MNVCCCKYHVELDMLQQGVNNLRNGIKGAHVSNASTCQCVVCYHDGATKQDICAAHTRVYKGVTKLWEECVCTKGEFEEWHKLACLMGDYVDCGVAKSSIYPNECSTNASWAVAWTCFEQDIIRVTDEGKPKKRIK